MQGIGMHLKREKNVGKKEKQKQRNCTKRSGRERRAETEGQNCRESNEMSEKDGNVRAWVCVR